MSLDTEVEQSLKTLLLFCEFCSVFGDRTLLCSSGWPRSWPGGPTFLSLQSSEMCATEDSKTHSLILLENKEGRGEYTRMFTCVLLKLPTAGCSQAPGGRGIERKVREGHQRPSLPLGPISQCTPVTVGAITGQV